MTLFYTQPAALTPDAHAGTRLAPRNGFRFAHATNAIPLAADEFAEAQAHYPIVFTRDPQPIAIAVVGLRDHENLFVADDGSWRPGSYVPAYVRRYPFGLVEVQGSKRRVLAIDATPETISTEQGAPLFEEAQPSATTKRALAFCTLFAAQQHRAAAFAAALKDADILVARGIEYRRGKDGPVQRFNGFQMVDETRFNALPPARITDWHACGFLPLVYAHLMSIRRFAGLANLAVAEAGSKPEDAPAEHAAAEHDAILHHPAHGEGLPS